MFLRLKLIKDQTKSNLISNWQDIDWTQLTDGDGHGLATSLSFDPKKDSFLFLSLFFPYRIVFSIPSHEPQRDLYQVQAGQ